MRFTDATSRVSGRKRSYETMLFRLQDLVNIRLNLSLVVALRFKHARYPRLITSCHHVMVVSVFFNTLLLS